MQRLSTVGAMPIVSSLLHVVKAFVRKLQLKAEKERRDKGSSKVFFLALLDVRVKS